jgi:HlyD family secretion protein
MNRIDLESSADWLHAEPRGARLVIGLLVGLLVLLAGVAILGRVDQVAVAPGRLVPASPVAAVQAREAGTVAQVYVTEGQTVAAGDLLVRIEPKLADAALSAAVTEASLAIASLERVEAELASKPLQLPTNTPESVATRVRAQHAANLSAFTTTRDRAQRALDEAGSRQRIADARIVELEQTLVRFRDEERALGELAEKGYVSRHMLLAKERERISAEQGLVAARHEREAASASIDQYRQQLRSVTEERQQELEAERVALTGQVERLSAQQISAEVSRASTEVRAAVSGRVKDLAVTGVGGVVAAGEILMTVIPESGPLKAEVWLENRDAARVAEGLPVRIKIEAVDFQRYGVVSGVIESIAPDSSAPRWTSVRNRADTGGIETLAADQSYRVLVALDDPRKQPMPLPINAGMRVTAEILVGDRSVAEYLLSPVTRTAREALREAG